jgi:cytoskeletal protein RodZ
MNRASRWWYLNPMEWLKIAYETFGAKHPAVSLIAVMVLGALIAGAVWLLGAQQYEKTQTGQNTPTTPSTNTTSGPQSPIMPNNSGTVTITNEENRPGTLAPKERPK